jgi:hypothetical protein
MRRTSGSWQRDKPDRRYLTGGIFGSIRNSGGENYESFVQAGRLDVGRKAFRRPGIDTQEGRQLCL